MLTLLTALICLHGASMGADSLPLYLVGYSSIQVITGKHFKVQEYFNMVKVATSAIRITPFSANCVANVRRSPHSLIIIPSPDNSTLESLPELPGQVVVVSGMDCQLIKIAKWGEDFYCWNGNGFVEKYKVGDQVVRQVIRGKNLVRISSQRVQRRSDLMGLQFSVTALASGDRNYGLVYGDHRVARISGSFGDLFNIMRETLNFTFSLRRPADNKWGGQNMARPSGWNGMIGQIAEGEADFSIGPWTMTAQRAEVIDWTLGNLMVDKQFFTGKVSQEFLHFSSFLEPFSVDVWLVVFATIMITGCVLFLVTWQAREINRDSFDLRQSLTFSFSCITFIRRWTVTPVSLSGRIVFITILVTGILIQGIWKASLTSVMAAQKTKVLYNSVDELLDAGVLPIVEKSSAQEGSFRFAKSGPFKEAWDTMKNNDQAFWISRAEAAQRIIRNPKIAVFESIAFFESTTEYLTCQAEALPGSYFKGQWAIPVKKGFEFQKLFNLMILKMRESGIHDYTFKHYEQKKDIHAECGIKEGGSIIKIANVISAFIIYVAGFSVSVALLIFEIVFTKMNNYIA
jgi:ABC-type amino acid transport substrate-binding protein